MASAWFVGQDMLRTVEITRYTGEKELAKFHRWIQESTQEATAAWALVERKSGKMEMIGSDKLRFIGDSIDKMIKPPFGGFSF